MLVVLVLVILVILVVLVILVELASFDPHALSKHTILTMSSTSRMTDWATALSLSINAPVPGSTTIPHFWGSADGDWSTVKFPATAKRSSPNSLSSGRERVRLSQSISPSAARMRCTLPFMASIEVESTLVRVEPSRRRNMDV